MGRRNARDEVQRSVGLYVVQHTLYQGRDIVVPLVPVMAACYGVELIAEMPSLQHSGESAVGRQKTFLIATGEKEIWSLSRIG